MPANTLKHIDQCNCSHPYWAQLLYTWNKTNKQEKKFIVQSHRW